MTKFLNKHGVSSIDLKFCNSSKIVDQQIAALENCPTRITFPSPNERPILKLNQDLKFFNVDVAKIQSKRLPC